MSRRHRGKLFLGIFAVVSVFCIGQLILTGQVFFSSLISAEHMQTVHELSLKLLQQHPHHHHDHHHRHDDALEPSASNHTEVDYEHENRFQFVEDFRNQLAEKLEPPLHQINEAWHHAMDFAREKIGMDAPNAEPEQEVDRKTSWVYFSSCYWWRNQ